MNIYLPPTAVVGAPNLSKGSDVFHGVKDSTDTVIETTQDDLVRAILTLDRVHNPKMVHDILEEREVNGYGTRSKAENLHSLHSVAIICAAAERAAATGEPVFAPVSGFHHAGYAFCGGFCTFNGLVAAADRVKTARPEANVLIIDGDGHHGNGTVDLIQRNGRRDWLLNCDLSRDATKGDVDLAMDAIQHALALTPWDLVLYQAGADAHVADPYGEGYLSDVEWAQRDVLIFSECKKRDLPIVFNLAGGYNGKKTLSLHSRTFLSALQVYEPESARLPFVRYP